MAEELQSGVSLNTETLGKLGVDGGIDLGELDLLEIRELLRGLGILWSELLAVPTPRRV